MGDMLSQAEIDALLNGGSGLDHGTDNSADTDLTTQEVDALGEIGNISMGTSATTLFTLLQQKVLITTPKVTITSWDELSAQYDNGYVGVKVEYTHGLVGANLLLMKDRDVKIITDLMMGGEGTNTEGELTDLHLSAISEAMNQMIGSSATSMSSMFNKRIDISPPKAFNIHFNAPNEYFDLTDSEKIVKIAFRMEIGSLIDSEIMQLIPISFAKKLVDNLLYMDEADQPSIEPPKDGAQVQTPTQYPQQQMQQQPVQPVYQQPQQPLFQQPVQQQYYMPETGYITQQGGFGYNEAPRSNSPVNVQPAQFQSFDDGVLNIERKNISLIMDVPLQVTVELGRTQKAIKDILEFGTGSIIELDKLAGEPVDILVNGKAIAKGEVVVIDESFGVRITDIIQPSKRL